MTRHLIIAAFCLCLVINAVPVSQTQQINGQDQRSGVTIRIDTDLVVIDVTATDKSGNYVRDLRADELQVFEDGRLRKIDFFAMTDESALSRPLAVVFALDVSGSLRADETATLREAAMKFTELMKDDSVFAAMAFNHKVKIVQDFTPSPEKIERAFAKMNKFEGSTRIYDAIDRAVTMLNKHAPRSRNGRPVRRVVIVITDGFDSASIIDRKELIQRANEAGVSIYSITLPSYMLSPTQSVGRVITPLDASRVITATGGRDFPADAQDFTPVFKSLAEEIRASYAVAYYPETRDGKQHELRVRTLRAGIQLRTSRTKFTAPSR